MNTSDNSRPIVLDYLGDYRIVNRVLFWKAKGEHQQRVDLLMRIEDELMRNLDALDIVGLSYCIPWADMDRLGNIRPNIEPTQLYHSDKYHPRNRKA